MSRAIFLTTSEMRILLYKKRISGLMIFEDLTKPIESENDVKNAVESMISNGYLVPDIDSFRFSDEIERIIAVLSKSQRAYRIRAMQDRQQAICMYTDAERAVLMTMDKRCGNMIRIEEADMEEAVDSLTENDYMPQIRDNESLEKIEDPEILPDLQDAFMDNDSRLLIEAYGRNSMDIVKSILIKEGSTHDYMYVNSEYGTECFYYSAKGLLREFREEDYGIG